MCVCVKMLLLIYKTLQDDSVHKGLLACKEPVNILFKLTINITEKIIVSLKSIINLIDLEVKLIFASPTLKGAKKRTFGSKKISHYNRPPIDN